MKPESFLNTSLEQKIPSDIDQELSEKIYFFFQKLNKLDLQLVAKKLISNNGNAWTAQKTENAISLYKMYLCLHFLFPKIQLVPTKDIDEVWHAHILLNTYKYIQDSQELYGYILHHYSCIDETETVQQQYNSRAGEITKMLLSKIFEVCFFSDTKYQLAACLILPLPNQEISA